MLRITNKLTTTTTLLLRSKAYFSQPIELNRRTSPVLQRVTSTPTWPVPYYQRLVKAYPIYGTLLCTQPRRMWTLSAGTVLLLTRTGFLPKRS